MFKNNKLKSSETITISNEEKLFLNIFARFMQNSVADTHTLDTFEEWKSLYSLSVEHHAIPIVYDGLEKVNMLNLVPSDIKGQWRKQAIGEMLFQARNTDNFLKIYKTLREAGIDVIVVKGIVCRNLYTKPDYRVSRDEDLYIQKKDFAVCSQILIENGFSAADYDEYYIPYEVSFYCTRTGLNIELHTFLYKFILTFTKQDYTLILCFKVFRRTRWLKYL